MQVAWRFGGGTRNDQQDLSFKSRLDVPKEWESVIC